MPQFRVTSEMHPGVYRDGVGFFRVGETLELPDAASKDGDLISLKFEPLDAEAREMLIDSQRRAKVLAETPAPEPKPADKVKDIPKKGKGKKKKDGDHHSEVLSPAKHAQKYGGATREADK